MAFFFFFFGQQEHGFGVESLYISLTLKSTRSISKKPSDGVLNPQRLERMNHVSCNLSFLYTTNTQANEKAQIPRPKKKKLV